MTLKHSHRSCLALLILFHITSTTALASDESIDEIDPSLETPALIKGSRQTELEATLEATKETKAASSLDASRDTPLKPKDTSNTLTQTKSIESSTPDDNTGTGAEVFSNDDAKPKLRAW